MDSINLEKERGRYVYEIEGFTSTREYDMKINALTKKVISVERD
nr:PepSY domain-containing protein [Lactobacillus kitasatonis]